MGLYDEFRGCVAADKWCARCVMCGQEHLKKRMTTVLFKTQYSNPKTVCHLCESCVLKICDEYELSM